MLVVTVEVWPGGRILQRKVIGSLTLVNVSDLADVSNYEGYLDGYEPVEVHGHVRTDGAWALVRRALACGDASEADVGG